MTKKELLKIKKSGYEKLVRFYEKQKDEELRREFSKAYDEASESQREMIRQAFLK